MSPGRVAVLLLVAGALGLAVGRLSTSSSPAKTSAPAPPAPAMAASGDACKAELTDTRAQFAICRAYARPPVEARPVPSAPPAATEPEGMDGLLGEARRIRAWADASRELIYLRYRDGRVRAYRPEDGPPDAGDLEGAHVIMHKLPDGVLELYDPQPATVRLFGPPGPDGLYTHPDGTRVRFVFTDAGAQ